MIFSEFDWDESWNPTEIYRDCPWSQHARQWKTLMLVCRFWHEAAIRKFYRTVYLFRFDQIISLIQTLEMSAVEEGNIAIQSGRLRDGMLIGNDVCYGYGRWVRRIYMQIFLPAHLDWYHVFQPTIDRLLAGCSSLQTLIEMPVGDGEHEEEARSSLIHLMNNPPSHSFSTMNQTFLFSVQRLQSLAIVLHKNVFPGQMLFLPVLRTLRCTIQQDALHVLCGLTNNWKLPDLMELSITYRARTNTWHTMPNDDAKLTVGNALLRDFCLVHGANVISFTLDNRATDGCLSLPGLFSNTALFPRLKRLTYSYQNSESFASRHTGERKSVFEFVQHVSLLPSYQGSRSLPSLTNLLRHLQDFVDTESFPALGRVMLLDPIFDELPFTNGVFKTSCPIEDINLTRSDHDVQALEDLQRLVERLDLGRMLSVQNRLGQRLVVDSVPPPILDDGMQL